jgi:hypothetical protein
VSSTSSPGRLDDLRGRQILVERTRARGATADELVQRRRPAGEPARLELCEQRRHDRPGGRRAVADVRLEHEDRPRRA